MRKFDLFTKTLAMVGFLQACTLAVGPHRRGKGRRKGECHCNGGCFLSDVNCKGPGRGCCACLFFICV